MKALCWHGKGDVRVDTVPDPKIENSRDAIVRITSTAICGSDLHLFDGYQPTMEKGDILGHEPMGIVEEVGKSVTGLKKGDRVVVPFTISCGTCWYCERSEFSLCDSSEPKRGSCPGGDGAIAGRVVRVLPICSAVIPGGRPNICACLTPMWGRSKIESDLPDEKVLFLSDIFPTGYMAAENACIEKGDTVAVWGCGPVAQFAIPERPFPGCSA